MRLMKKITLLAVVCAASLPVAASARDHDRWDNRWDHGRRWDDHDRRWNRGYYRDNGWRYDPHYRPYYRSNIVIGRPYISPEVYVFPKPRRVIYQSQPVYVSQITLNNEVQGTAGRYCREYQSNVRVGGGIRQSYGTACMQPDGNWEIVN